MSMFWWQNPLHPDLGSPFLQRCLKNQELLTQAPHITEFEFGRRSKSPIKSYQFHEGICHTTHYEGEVTDKELRLTKGEHEICKLTHPDSDFWLIWVPCESGIADIPVEHMGAKSFGLLQRYLRNVGRVIFDIQDHERATARADIPDNDTGTWRKDRRKENVLIGTTLVETRTVEGKDGSDQGSAKQPVSCRDLWTGGPPFHRLSQLDDQLITDRKDFRVTRRRELLLGKAIDQEPLLPQ